MLKLNRMFKMNADAAKFFHHSLLANTPDAKDRNTPKAVCFRGVFYDAGISDCSMDSASVSL